MCQASPCDLSRVLPTGRGRARQIFFVDDRPENVDGARQAGFDAVLYEGATHLAKALRRRGLTFNY